MQFPLSWYYSHGVFPFIHLDLKKKEAWQKLLSKQIESKRKKYEAITYIPNGNGSTLDYSQIIPRKIMREMELKCDKFGGREIDSLDSSKGNLINLSLCNSFFKWKLKKKNPSKNKACDTKRCLPQLLIFPLTSGAILTFTSSGLMYVNKSFENVQYLKE